MVEYNYIYKMLNNYGSQIHKTKQNTKEWKNITEDFAIDLYNTLIEEEKIMLGQIRNSSSSTYEIKWGNNNDFV